MFCANYMAATGIYGIITVDCADFSSEMTSRGRGLARFTVVLIPMRYLCIALLIAFLAFTACASVLMYVYKPVLGCDVWLVGAKDATFYC
jgi:hypothetical protein